MSDITPIAPGASPQEADSAAHISTRQVVVRYSHELGRHALCPFCCRACGLDAPETRCAHFTGQCVKDGSTGESMTAGFSRDGRPGPELLPLGECVVTPGARDAAQELGIELRLLLSRHAGHDWGDVDEHDWAMNDESARDGERCLSAYEFPGGVRFWVVTEAERGFTTLLLPGEY